VCAQNVKICTFFLEIFGEFQIVPFREFCFSCKDQSTAFIIEAGCVSREVRPEAKETVERNRPSLCY
jgi:hypothetical protein